jgi:hypothetical protein
MLILLILLIAPLPPHLVDGLCCACYIVLITGLLAAHELRERIRALLATLSNSALDATPHAGQQPSSMHSPSPQHPFPPRSHASVDSTCTHSHTPRHLVPPGGAAAFATSAALPAHRDVLTALTSSSAGECFNSEAAELLGDAVLDFLAVLYLFHTLKCVVGPSTSWLCARSLQCWTS